MADSTKDSIHEIHTKQGRLFEWYTTRYGFRIDKLPLHCGCGKQNNIDHALTYATGGHVILFSRLFKIRDTYSRILKDVCTGVKTEPPLISIDADFNKNLTGNRTDCAHLDVSCVGIWSPLEKTLMDIRIFHPCIPLNMNKSEQTLYSDNERSKKSVYNQH